MHKHKEGSDETEMKGIACLLSFASCSEISTFGWRFPIYILAGMLQIYTTLHLWDAAGTHFVKKRRNLDCTIKLERRHTSREFTGMIRTKCQDRRVLLNVSECAKK